MRVTILGSCRQESLLSLYPCTTIRDRLTYPHYTKEAVQAIEFCKGISPIPVELTQFMFRTGILDNKQLAFESFHSEFKATTVFVIEIASRIAYEYMGFYAHHILTEPKYGFQHIPSIGQRDLTDHEIEQDLLRMKELVYPKKMMIVSHIYSRKTGKRYELVQLLRSLCMKHSIPFFDPVEQLGECDQERVYVKEDRLAHYSDLGHSMIREKYKEFIDRL